MLSKHQESRLRNGHTITLKHEQIAGSGLDISRLSHTTQKKLSNAYNKGKNVRISLTAEELQGQGFNNVKGKGFKGHGFAHADLEGGALIGKHTFRPLQKAIKKTTGLSTKETYMLGRVGEAGLKAGTVAALGTAGAMVGSYGGPIGTAVGSAAGKQAGTELNKQLWGSGFAPVVGRHISNHSIRDSTMINPLNPAIQHPILPRPTIAYRPAF